LTPRNRFPSSGFNDFFGTSGALPLQTTAISAGLTMRNDFGWTIFGVQLGQALPLAVVSATIGFATPAMAAGTAAGTTISNTATATYNDPGGNPRTVDSNTVDFRVDEILDVTVVADPGDVIVAPGTNNQVVAFTVTNNGNGSEAFRLTANPTIGGDQFDPGTVTIVLDTNGDGVYTPGVDTVYVPGTNDPVLAPDAAIKVFILSSIPGGANDLDRGFVDLTAAAVTGTGAPGTSFNGQGDNGVDAIVGTTGADSTDRGRYLVQTATVAFTKAQSVADPFGGSQTVPGAIVTYTLVATVSGTGTLTNLALGDPIPANTTYQPNTLTLQGAALTDGADADAGEFASNAVAVRLGSVTGGQTRTVTFKVRIN
jgi:uncharacterized repeat protein (TIGR01451 family)